MATAAVATPKAPAPVKPKTVLYYSIYPRLGCLIAVEKREHDRVGNKEIQRRVQAPIKLQFLNGRCEVSQENHEAIVASGVYNNYWGMTRGSATEAAASGEWAPAKLLGEMLDSEDQDDRTLARKFVKNMFHYHTHGRAVDIKQVDETTFIETLRKEMGARGFTRIGRMSQDMDKVAAFAKLHDIPVEKAKKMLEDMMSLELPAK